MLTVSAVMKTDNSAFGTIRSRFLGTSREEPLYAKESRSTGEWLTMPNAIHIPETDYSETVHLDAKRASRASGQTLSEPTS